MIRSSCCDCSTKKEKTSSLDLGSSVVYEVIALGQSERISETCYADQPKTGKERESCLWQWVWGYHRTVSQRVTVGQSQGDGEDGRRIWTLFTQCVLSYLHVAPYHKTHTGQFRKTDRKLNLNNTRNTLVISMEGLNCCTNFIYESYYNMLFVFCKNGHVDSTIFSRKKIKSSTEHMARLVFNRLIWHT